MVPLPVYGGVLKSTEGYSSEGRKVRQGEAMRGGGGSRWTETLVQLVSDVVLQLKRLHTPQIATLSRSYDVGGALCGTPSSRGARRRPSERASE